MAVSLQQQGGATGALSDLELARQLQQEEYQNQQHLQNQQQGEPPAAPQVTAVKPRPPKGLTVVSRHLNRKLTLAVLRNVHSRDELGSVVVVMMSLCFQARGQGSQQGGARRKDKDSDCVIL